MKPTCPLCTRRRAGRECPALGRRICAVCCGTKRQVEINCPPDCSYLRTSQAHPPAVVQRQQERDMLFVLPMMQGLTTRQQEVLVLIQGFLRTERPDAAGVVDDDVARAARALAETYETASRGIIYEHVAALPAAARLGADIKALVELTRGEGITLRDADIAVALRRIGKGVERSRRRGRRQGAPGRRNGVPRIVETGASRPAGPADRPALDEPADVSLDAAPPDHSTVSRTRRRIDVETHLAVFTWVLQRLADAGLVGGKTVGIDATTLEANAALRSIVRRRLGTDHPRALGVRGEGPRVAPRPARINAARGWQGARSEHITHM